MGIDNKTYAAAKTYTNKVALGFQSVTQTATGFTITFKDGSTATYNVQNMHEHTNKNILDLLSVDSNGNLLYDGKSISPDFIDVTGDGTKFLADDGTYKVVTTGGVAYDDTQVKADIQTNADNIKTNADDITAIKTQIGNTTMGTTATDVKGAVKEIYDSQLDTVSFSSDYKNIVLNRKNGLNPYSIPIAAIINHAKLIELADVNTTDIGNGKTLVYDTATQKHKYVSSSATDELVKMDSTTDAHYLEDLLDKQTIINDNGVLKVKKLDGQEVTITEINYLKGLTMNVMELVNMFSNGGVKIINTPVATYADLLTYDKTSFIGGISYLVYVLADETHDNAKTTYLIDKDTSTPTYFGFAGEQRDFTTNPIDLANEVTGKLGASNIDVDSLWALLTIDDTYKTLTTTDNVFGTHGAKKLYDELTTEIGKKANTNDLTTHTGDTNIHITSSERTKWNKVDGKVDKTDIVDNLTSTDTNKPLSANQGKALNDSKVDKTELDKINANLGEKADVSELAGLKRRYKSIEELNAIKKKSLTLVNGEDNTQKVLDALDAGEVLSDYFSNAENVSRFGISSSLGTHFIITFEKNDNGYAKITANSTSSDTILVRYHSANELGAWQRVYTTSVADVPITYINTFEDETYVKPSNTNACSYQVINGHCIIRLETFCLTSTTHDFVQIFSGLPKPTNELFSNIIDRNMQINSGARGVYSLLPNGTLRIVCDNGDTSTGGPRYFYATFSYPVAES